MTVSQHGGHHDADAMEPELIAAIGIRWLAGRTYVDIRHVYACHVAPVFLFRDMFSNAVSSCKELEIVFADTDEHFKSTAAKFADKNPDGIMIGCVGAIDGLFVKKCCPSMAECGHSPQAYFLAITWLMV